KKEMDLANVLIDSMSDKFDASKYKDEYHDKVLQVIQMKVAGVSPQAPAGKPKGPAQVVDLMEILKQSLKEKGGSRAAAAVEEEVAKEDEPVGAGAGRTTKAARPKKAR